MVPGEELPTLHSEFFSFLSVIVKVCLPSSPYLDSRSLVNVGSFLHMTMVVCEKSTLGPIQGNECLKYYFKSSHFRRLFTFIQRMPVTGQSCWRSCFEDCLPRVSSWATWQSQPLHFIGSPFILVFNPKWLHSRHLPDWPLDDFQLFPEIIKSTPFHWLPSPHPGPKDEDLA